MKLLHRNLENMVAKLDEMLGLDEEWASVPTKRLRAIIAELAHLRKIEAQRMAVLKANAYRHAQIKETF